MIANLLNVIVWAVLLGVYIHRDVKGEVIGAILMIVLTILLGVSEKADGWFE